MCALYSKVEYWNERYAKSRDQPPYEWYQDYHTLSHLLNPHTLSGTGGHPNMVSMTDRADDASASTAIVTNASAVNVYDCMHPSKCRVLILGCGNSSLGANMFEAGWRGGMTQLDYSSVVIDQMKERYNDQYYQHLFFGPHAAAANLNIDNNNNKSKQVPKMDFLCLDVTQTPLPFDGGSFDLIICKGLFDALLCSANSVFNVRRFVKDCLRLLNDNGGALMICTYGNPDNRVVFLEDEEGDLTTYWAGVHLHKVPSRIRNSNSKNGSNHGPIKNDYVYVCRKRSGAFKESPVEISEKKMAASKKQETGENSTTAATPQHAEDGVHKDSEAVVESTSTEAV